MADIRSKRPKVLGARVAGLRLTQEERFVMARIDGEKSVDELAGVTGLAPERLEQIVTKLAFDGAVDLSETRAAPVVLPLDEGETSMADFAAALGLDPNTFQDKKAAPVPSAPPSSPPPGTNEPPRPRRPKIVRKQRPDSLEEDHAALVGEAPIAQSTQESESAPIAVPESNPYSAALEGAAVEAFSSVGRAEKQREEVALPSMLPEIESAAQLEPQHQDASGGEAEEPFVLGSTYEANTAFEELEEVPDELEEVHELEEVGDELEEVRDGDELEEVAEDEGVTPQNVKEEEIARAVQERNYREVFEKRWHALPVDARVAGAKIAKGPDLLALCFDPDPRVISAVLENATAGLDHVRLIAFYHRTNTGLEILARRQDWIRDLLVERRLLRNPMIGDIVLTRVMNPKRLFPTYKIAIDRDVPELSRAKVRGMIRKKWATAPAEERADLLFRTEARCLNIMTGCTFDAKTTAILCGRPINSVMFVQSISKFPSSPPALLAHLFKQPFVRKNPPLKKMLLAHPNMPGDVKRGV